MLKGTWSEKGLEPPFQNFANIFNQNQYFVATNVSKILTVFDPIDKWKFLLNISAEMFLN